MVALLKREARKFALKWFKFALTAYFVSSFGAKLAVRNFGAKLANTKQTWN